VPPNFIEQEFLSASASGRSVLAAVWAPMMTLDLSSALLEVDHGGCGVWRRGAPVLEPVAPRPLAPLLNLTLKAASRPNHDATATAADNSRATALARGDGNTATDCDKLLLPFLTPDCTLMVEVKSEPSDTKLSQVRIHQ
jgi:hypothetical protein